MAVTFTEDQQKVIDTRNKNILVSAAAGSGKTAVLVERIIRRITDAEHPIDIDRLLVVTFTNAAAAGMKERISNAIQARLTLEPENLHLQRQAVLVHQAQITTIHSFCLYLIKNHFEAIALEPDFSVADEATVKLLAAEVKEQVLEEAFAKGQENFLYMVEFICHNGRESVLEDYMDQLYARAMSMPFPKKWLLERKKDYEFQDLEEFTGTDSGKYLLLHIRGLLQSYQEAYGRLYQIATEPDGPYMYADVLEAEQEYLGKVLRQESLSGIGCLLPNMEFARLPAKKDDSVHSGKKERVKELRTVYKKALQGLSAQFFGKSPQSIGVENAACKAVTEALVELTVTYMERLAAEKRKRGIIDFNDMEHMALQILLKETEEGYEPTEIARSYQEYFEEVMVDEYQDSNMVQEYLVTAVSGTVLGKNNRFMVGDVKQSIYKFRLARPELFMEKYHAYAEKRAEGNASKSDEEYEEKSIECDAENSAGGYTDKSDVRKAEMCAEIRTELGNDKNVICADESCHMQLKDKSDAIDAKNEGRMSISDGCDGRERTDDKTINEDVTASNRNIRIDLKQNFRSRTEVLAATNSIFEKVMLPELGGIAYDEHAALYPGAHYPEVPGMEAELIVATGDKPEHYDSKEWEAYCVSKRIKELVKEGQILDDTGKGFRPVTYADIVLLFRSPSSFEEAYKKVFAEQGIPLYMTSGSGYFDAVEIQNIVKLLQTIENPRLDIPLFGVCTSIFGGMCENQLAQVKVYYNELLRNGQASGKKGELSLYDMLCAYEAAFPEEETGQAIARLQKQLRKYRIQAEYMTVSELIYEILKDYQYREYMSVLPDGAKRLSNVSLLLEKAATFGNCSYQGLFAFTSYMNQLHKQSIDYGEAGLAEHGDAVRVMSIHKSKGLEFPVCIVCGMGQSYQMRDKQQLLLIDNDMGLGMDYINPTLRSKNKTLRKNVIALKMEQEILAEEQRILYVAMTRAKEKLIMVGYKEQFEEGTAALSSVTCVDSSVVKNCMLPDVLTARSYLDLCLLARDSESPIELRTVTTEDYVTAEIVETVTREERKDLLVSQLALETEGKLRDVGLTAKYKGEAKDIELNPKLTGHFGVSQSLSEAYEQRFGYQYPHANLKDLYSKTSVSELKKAAIAEEQEAVFDAFEKANEEEIIPYIPDFMKEKTEVKGAERGTAYHRVMELLDFTNAPDTARGWYQLLDDMIQSGKLAERQKECIYVPKMQEFMQSDIAKRMQKAAMQGFLHKEKSFFLGVPANRVNPSFPAEEIMLVQGIIDAYFEEDGELVLVDYKTDRVDNGQELVERYRAQMQYYAEALEKAIGKNVKEVVLYSISLGKCIPVPKEEFRKS